jgi:hypothetical protein
MERVVATLEIKTYQLEDFINIMLTNDYIVEIRNKGESKALVLVKEQLKEKVEE